MRLATIFSTSLVIFVVSELGKGNRHCSFPFDANGKPVKVDLRLLIFSLTDFQDVLGSLTFRASLISSWNDSCGWKVAEKLFPRKAETNQSIYVDSKHFWIPLISQDNSDVARAYEDTNMPVEVYKSGLHRFYGRKAWTATCKGQFSKFPFDVHICRLEFVSWFNTNFIKFSKLSIGFGSKEFYNTNDLAIFYAEYLEPEHFELSYPCGNKICAVEKVHFIIRLKRKWFPYYIFGVFLPLISLSILQFLSFFISHSNIDRITFSGTIFVANAFIIRDIRSYIPQTAEHIIIMTTISLASIGSLFSTLFHIFTFASNTKLKAKVLKKMKRIAISLFFIFSILLYFVTIVCLAL